MAAFLPRAHRAAAILCGCGALVFGAAYLAFPWRGHDLDFDVLGVAWLLMNLPKVVLGFMFLLAALGAVLYTIRSVFEW